MYGNMPLQGGLNLPLTMNMESVDRKECPRGNILFLRGNRKLRPSKCGGRGLRRAMFRRLPSSSCVQRQAL